MYIYTYIYMRLITCALLGLLVYLAWHLASVFQILDTKL